MLTGEGKVKLVDYGICCRVSRPSDKIKTCIGSPSWMAPEVVTCRDELGGYDARADVWALGMWKKKFLSSDFFFILNFHISFFVFDRNYSNRAGQWKSTVWKHAPRQSFISNSPKPSSDFIQTWSLVSTL